MRTRANITLMTQSRFEYSRSASAAIGSRIVVSGGQYLPRVCDSARHWGLDPVDPTQDVKLHSLSHKVRLSRVNFGITHDSCGMGIGSILTLLD